MNLREHAEMELKALGLDSKDAEYDGLIYQAIMELVGVFADQGHSGMSASIVRELFAKLADFKPLSPIQCTAEEWSDCDIGTIFQNKRCSAVFKDGIDGLPYYLDAIVWKTQDGTTWTGNAFDSKGNIIRSRQFVNLPFVPKTYVVDVIEKEVAKDDWEFYIKDDAQLDEVFEYYQKVETKVDDAIVSALHYKIEKARYFSLDELIKNKELLKNEITKHP
jgi:hypothetical protein